MAGTNVSEPTPAVAQSPTTERDTSFLTRIRRFQFPLFVVVVSILVAEGAYRSGVLATMEHLYTDLWHRTSGVRFTPENVALVVVDDQSLAEHGDVPMVFWTPLFARAAATLREAGATVIGVEARATLTPQGEMVVADGYGQYRVHRFDAQGQLVRTWGKRFLSEPYICGFLFFQWEPTYFNRPDIKAAMDELATVARGMPNKLCRP